MTASPACGAAAKTGELRLVATFRAAGEGEALDYATLMDRANVGSLPALKVYVSRLRVLGFGIDNVRGFGYRMTFDPQALSVRSVESGGTLPNSEGEALEKPKARDHRAAA